MAEEQSRNGGVDLSAEQIRISGDVVGRDKIVNSINVLLERALTAAEEAERTRSLEAQRLAQAHPFGLVPSHPHWHSMEYGCGLPTRVVTPCSASSFTSMSTIEQRIIE